jgi:DnaJ homologue, subfamily C, member 28, conserved domain
MLLDRIADARISEAMERGEFDDLPGRGEPLDLEDYFAAPPELRASLAVLKNAGVLPEEMELRRQIAALEALARADGAQRQRLEAFRLRLALLGERGPLARSRR